MTSTSVVRAHELPRKTLHLTSAVVPLSLWFGVSQRAVASLLVALFGVACVVEVVRRRSAPAAQRFDATVGQMLRPHERHHGITGATWLLAAFSLVCVAAPGNAAIAATWAGAVGDSSAALVGRAWRRARGGEGKSAAGSVSCALITAAGAWWLAGFGFAGAAGLGVIAALAERPTLALDDNARVATAVAAAATVMLVI
jgi:dolichol kinase